MRILNELMVCRMLWYLIWYFISEGRKKNLNNCGNDFKIFEISYKIHILNISGMKKNIISLYGKKKSYAESSRMSFYKEVEWNVKTLSERGREERNVHEEA